MQDLKVSIVQTDLTWRDPECNLHHFDALIDSIAEPTDLVVLPEMFTTGFTMQPESLAEAVKSTTLKWMLGKSAEKECAVMGSYIVEEHGKYLNRLYIVFPNGESFFYDKKHLFRMAEEDKFFTPGNERLVVKLKGWKLSLLICYDLRFPVWCRNSFKDGDYGFDCQIFVANWPEIRNHAWKTLLTARAIENQSYVVGVNRIGSDGNGIAHSGDSMVIDPWGAKISETLPHQESVETITLSTAKLNSFRKNVTFGLDWDDFELKQK
jgi:omega-amidase